MQRLIESSSAHAEMVNKFQNVFPNLALGPLRATNSIYDALNDIISKIPKPRTHETKQTISSMKNYVDGQELRIQINMIEIEQAEPLPLQAFTKRCSAETRDSDDSWDGRSIEQADWAWDQKDFHYNQSLEHEFSSYLD